VEHLAVAASGPNRLADTFHRVAKTEQAGRLARGQRPHRRQQVDAEGRDHREQRPQEQRDQHHLEGGPIPAGDDPRRDHAQGPAHHARDRECEPTAARTEQAARPEGHRQCGWRPQNDPPNDDGRGSGTEQHLLTLSSGGKGRAAMSVPPWSATRYPQRTPGVAPVTHLDNSSFVATGLASCAGTTIRT
jgi:hypothetical protein